MLFLLLPILSIISFIWFILPHYFYLTLKTVPVEDHPWTWSNVKPSCYMFTLITAISLYHDTHHMLLIWFVCSVAQSCLTLCDPVDCSTPGFSVHRIFQARILEWVAISFFRGSSWPRVLTWVFCMDRWILYQWATREAHIRVTKLVFAELEN